MLRFLSLACLLAVACASSSKQVGFFKESRRRFSFEAEIKIPETRDRLLQSKNTLNFLVEVKKKEPSRATLLLENFTDTFFPRTCREARLFADGVSVELSGLKKSAARDGISQALAAVIPAEGLARLASPEKVTGEVCGVSFSLSELQVGSLHEMIRALNLPGASVVERGEE